MLKEKKTKALLLNNIHSDLAYIFLRFHPFSLNTLYIGVYCDFCFRVLVFEHFRFGCTCQINVPHHHEIRKELIYVRVIKA